MRIWNRSIHIRTVSWWPQNWKNLCQAPRTGPRWALIAPKWLLVGLVIQIDWIDVLTVFILIVFKICWSSQSNNCVLIRNQNILIKNPILFCKYLSPRKLHRNGFIFKIFVWISVFGRKYRFENPILGCRDIKRTRSLIFLGHPVLTS